MSSIALTSRTQSSLTFKITLTSAFTSDNYICAGVCTAPFENGTKDSSSIKYPCASYQYTSSTEISLTVTSYNGSELEAGKSYTFYGFARAKHGGYYCIPLPQKALTVSTLTAATTVSSDKPYNLVCVKRMQSAESTMGFIFHVTVPQNTTYLRFQIGRTERVTEDLVLDSGKAPVEDFDAVSERVYRFDFLEASPCTTYYIQAACQQGSAGLSAFCEVAAVTSPPSNYIFEQTKQNFRFVYSETEYGGIAKHLRLYIRKDAFTYDFSSVQFEIYRDNTAQYVSYIDKGSSSLTACKDKTVIALTREQLTGKNVNGVLIENPLFGDYTGVVRIFYDINGRKLQPVDEHGNEVCGMYYCTVEQKEVRPDRFEWDNEKVSGAKVNLTANEWNRLTENINEVSAYKGQNDRIFTKAVKNSTTVDAQIVNEVTTALRALGGTVNNVSAGDKMYASIFEAIKNEINSVE